ncbi:MAG: hydantoinase/oxoprolinase family protein [Protaetiibacter sp.]
MTSGEVEAGADIAKTPVYYLGTDVGGTFTDLMLYTDEGDVSCVKVPSTPQEPARSTLQGVEEITRQRGLDPRGWQRLNQTHSSTIATNALIERTGAVVGLLVNQGFRDLLELQRLVPADPSRYDSRRPAPLVPRRHVREIAGRLDARGEELGPIDEAEVVTAADELVAAGVEVIAVCLLHSYANPAHERRVKEIIEAVHPGLPVELSSFVWAQAREFERAALTTMNCHVRPVIERYVDGLVQGMAMAGVQTDVCISRSNGGMQSAATLRTRPIVAALSGPSAGVAGAALTAAAAGMPDADLITFDVGGTSADVGVIRGGKPLLSTEERVADLPLMIPTVAVSSIGAGGGSMLWLDSTGKLRVGPRSVGSVPGPACYGSGSTIPSVTDAFLVAGLLDAEAKLGDRIRPDLDAARRAMEPLAQGLGATIESVADDAIAIATAMMAAEVIKAVARYGADTPEFGMVAFGGAGPMLAALVAAEAHLPTVLIPVFPGTLSAMGAALASAEADFVEPAYAALDDEGGREIGDAYASLAARSRRWLDTEAQVGGMIESTRVLYSGEVRYEGQGYDLNVAIEEDWLRTGDTSRIRQAFAEEHLRTYGHANPTGKARIQELRAHVVAELRKPRMLTSVGKRPAEPIGRRELRLWGRPHVADVYLRDTIAVGQRIDGVAILNQMDTTTVIPPGWYAEVTPSGSLLLKAVRGSRQGATDQRAYAGGRA